MVTFSIHLHIHVGTAETHYSIVPTPNGCIRLDITWLDVVYINPYNIEHSQYVLAYTL